MHRHARGLVLFLSSSHITEWPRVMQVFYVTVFVCGEHHGLAVHIRAAPSQEGPLLFFFSGPDCTCSQSRDASGLVSSLSGTSACFVFAFVHLLSFRAAVTNR